MSVTAHVCMCMYARLRDACVCVRAVAASLGAGCMIGPTACRAGTSWIITAKALKAYTGIWLNE